MLLVSYLSCLLRANRHIRQGLTWFSDPPLRFKADELEWTSEREECQQPDNKQYSQVNGKIDDVTIPGEVFLE
jgi:hypothetical protein